MSPDTDATPATAVLEIPRSELRARVGLRDPDLVLVDVLTPDSFAAGHVPTAINLPYADLSAEVVARALPDRHADITVYCGGYT